MQVKKHIFKTSLSAQSKRHQQFILAVDAGYFKSFDVDTPEGNFTIVNFKDGINAYPAFVFLDEVQSHIVIRERDWLDNQVHQKWQHRAGDKPFKGDPGYRQFLPYCVIRIALENGEWSYFLYRREDTVGEARLAGNVSAGYGGHVDLVDVVFNEKSVIDLEATLRLSSRREIFGEETAIYDVEGKLVDPETLEVRFADKFITQETEVESLHVGIVMTLDLPVGYRVETPENELTSMEPMTARQLLASGLPIEHWTRAIMEDDVREQQQFEEATWEDVKDLSLTLDGHDANNAAFNETVSGIPTTPPTPEQVAAYQDKLGQELESNVDTLEIGLAEAPRVNSNQS